MHLKLRNFKEFLVLRYDQKGCKNKELKELSLKLGFLYQVHVLVFDW